MNTFMMDLLLYRINTAVKKHPLKLKLSKVPVQDAAYQTVYQGIFDKFKAKDYEMVILLQLVLDYFFFADLDRQNLYEPMADFAVFFKKYCTQNNIKFPRNCGQFLIMRSVSFLWLIYYF